MKMFFRIICTVLLSAGMLVSVFADYGFTVDSSSRDSISLSWEAQEGADFYQVSYGTNSQNYTQTSDILEEPSYDLLGLQENTEYFFTVEGFDNSGNSLFVSEELTANTGVKTLKDTATKSFSLQKVEQTGVDEIILTFSNPLSTTQDPGQREFTIESLEDSSNYFDVFVSEIDPSNPNQIILTLDGEPSQGVEYKVVVISLEDVAGNNIEFGIDSENTFIGKAAVDMNSAQENTNNTPNENTNTQEQEEEKNTPKEVVAETPNTGGVSAKDMKKEELGEDVHSVSQNKEDLPQTGPEHLLLFFVALLLSAFFFIPKYVKK